LSRLPTEARWDSDGHVLAPRRMIAQVMGRNLETVSRRCAPVACDVVTRAVLYDVDEACTVLAELLPGTPRVKKRRTVAKDLDQ
jgi:hypothetical protein